MPRNDAAAHCRSGPPACTAPAGALPDQSRGQCPPSCPAHPGSLSYVLHADLAAPARKRPAVHSFIVRGWWIIGSFVWATVHGMSAHNTTPEGAKHYLLQQRIAALHHVPKTHHMLHVHLFRSTTVHRLNQAMLEMCVLSLQTMFQALCSDLHVHHARAACCIVCQQSLKPLLSARIVAPSVKL